MSELRESSRRSCLGAVTAEAIHGRSRPGTRTRPIGRGRFAKLRRRSLAIAGLSTWLFGAAAQAHQVPANCNGNGIVLNMSRSPSSVVVGGTVTYNISIANLGDPSINLIACDVTNTTVVFYCPAANGAPDFGNPVVITTTLNLPSNTPAMSLGSQMCTLAVNPGVTNAVADVRAGDQSGDVDNAAEGGLHDATVDDPFRAEKLLGTEVVTTTTSTSTSTSTSSSTSTSTSSSTSSSTTSSTSSSTSSSSSSSTSSSTSNSSSSTSTSTSSTSTSTIPHPINHVQCYEVKPAAFTTKTVTAQDQFGTLALSVRFPHRLCAPADKNGEGILNPTEHLTGYNAKAPFTKQRNQTVVDQFGTQQLDVVRASLFMVPTAKNGVAITPPVGDHFTCYKVRRSRGAAKFTPRTVSVVDQFETVSETLVKPVLLCAPSSKNGEDPTAPAHPNHLLCYKIKTTPFGSVDVSLGNQFGPDQRTLIHRRELCVPALKNPNATSTTSTSTTTSSTSSSTTLVGSPSGSFVDTLSL